MERPMYYILQDKTPVPVKAGLREWASFFEDPASRTVARTELPGDILVSTIFLGIDTRLPSDQDPPLLFETRVFGGPMDGLCMRHATWAEAAAGHRVAVGQSIWKNAEARTAL